ncbi:SDR family NAD(P)-dependent oxidoreductase [Amycolatopsis sacchari]|uniref:type I polyketide synthase n=1 Tax=Amycolatopsis sacchari TaxID=115433 RepID=UPI003D72BAF5
MSTPLEPIAIVGMAGRFPGAHDVGELWANLAAGRGGLRTLPDEELLAAGVTPAELADERYVRVNGDAPDVDLFDAPFFTMTPREAAVCDPQVRLFLETAHAAVENAGYDSTALSDVGVFASVGHSLYWDHNLRITATSMGGRDLTASVFNYPDYVATLVSYKLDFTGPSMTVMTACSSSLLTLHLAIQSLHNGECEMALAGGADVEMLGHGYTWTSGSPVSRDGRCRSFGAGATGTVFSTGVGVVAVKRLSDALADGDHVHAVVRATAATNDGADKVGFSAPSVSGQVAAIVEALALGGVAPEDVGYVEAHGTGTPLGDPIEFTALTDAFRRAAEGRPLPSGYCGLGSVKSNVGHLGHAAGVAALIKTALCLEHEQLVPTLHVTEPNPELDWGSSPFSLVTEPRPWPRTPGRPRFASINSLGFGGTNVHAVLEEPPVRAPAAPSVPRPRLVVWSGRTEAAERAYREALSEHLAETGEEGFADTVATLQQGRTAHPVRAAVVADTASGTRAALNGKVLGTGAAGRQRPVVFLFPGQGSQHAGLARGLHGAEPAFTRAFDECVGLLADTGLRSAWPDGNLDPTELAQPALFAVEYALAKMWQAWGIRPAMLLGHSIGELVAATVAGVFTLPDAAKLVAARGRAMAAMPPGTMLAVRAPAERVEALLPEGAVVAAANSPQQTVVGGPAEAVAEAERSLSAAGLTSRPVRTSHAFHSPMMRPAAETFAAAFDGITAAAPEIPVWSAATAAPLIPEQAASPEFWAGQLTTPVRFAEAVDAVLAEGDVVLVETGPERALTSLLGVHPDIRGGRHAVLPTLPRRGAEPDEDLRSALTALGTLWTEGHAVDWTAVADAPLRRVPVPGYQYQRSRHWITPEKPPVEIESTFTAPAWVEQVAAPGAATEDVDAVVLLPGDDETALSLAPALQQAGLRIVPVRPGPEYHDGGAAFRVRPGRAEDLERVLRTLAARDRSPRLLVHAWSAGDWAAPTAATVAEQLELTCHSLVDLVQWGARAAGAGRAPGLLVLTSRSADVSGGEPADPVKATLHGLVRTLALESPDQVCRLIDLGPGLSEDELVAELRAAPAEPVVALRRGRRWVRTERPFTPVPGGERVLRRDGVYLITGGLGGLGLALAKGLARSGLRPRLALVGRSEPGTAAQAKLDELTALGAQVRVFAADVADARAMRRVADTVTARFGPVTGIFHLAGVAGDGMLLFRERKAMAEVLAPKVRGTLVLEEVFADRPPLDFFVSFASRAGLDGLVGSGDYAAANAFLDAYAQVSRLARGRVLSVDWPAWAEVGMAAAPEPAAAVRAESVLSAEETPFADEHRVDGKPVLPGTGILDLVYRAYLAEVPGAGGAGAVRFSDVVLRQLLVLDEPRRTAVEFERDGDGWTFTVHSAPAGGGARTTHTTGRVEDVARSAPTVDAAALRERLSDRRSPAPLTEPRRLFQLGPRWDNVLELAFPPGGDRSEKLVTLRLPGTFAADLAGHPLHPALLDNAVSSARDPERDGLALPFMYRSLVVYGPLRPELHSHLVRRPGSDRLVVADVTIFTPGGQVLVECEGFTLHVVGRDVLTASREEAPPRAGIEPETGVRMLFDLLGARAVRQVAVRPHRDGEAVRPVPEPVEVAPEAAPAPEPEPLPAGDDIVARTRRLWGAVLGTDDISATDDFFELGGNSLAAIDLVSRVRKEFGIELNVAMLFDYPTLGALSDALRAIG